MSCVVGIMAYNEEANIATAIRSVLEQEGPHVNVRNLTVVASGCTDRTVDRVREAAASDPRVRLLEQTRREGKASAINTFLQSVPDGDLRVLVGGDTHLEAGALEALLAPFDDPAVGMTGGRPLPVNLTSTLMGRVVHLRWELHHEIALEVPKLGELVAFRPALKALPEKTAVDEGTIEASIQALGLRPVYVPEAGVRMQGPDTIRDFLDQRRRIYAGHIHLRQTQGYAVSTLSIGRILRAIGAVQRRGAVKPSTLIAATLLEAAARALGAMDERILGKDHGIWKAIPSTKRLLK